MNKPLNIPLFDASDDLTLEAIHYYKEGKLSKNQVVEVRKKIDKSPLDAKALGAYLTENKEKYSSLSQRLKDRIEEKAGSLEETTTLRYDRIAIIVASFLIISAIVFSLFSFSVI